MAVKGNKLEVENMCSEKLEDNHRIPSQKTADISHQGNTLLIQTPQFITGTYAIPRVGPYYQADKARTFSKLPFCHES